MAFAGRPLGLSHLAMSAATPTFGTLGARLRFATLVTLGLVSMIV
jgi:hypothetical protein